MPERDGPAGGAPFLWGMRAVLALVFLIWGISFGTALQQVGRPFSGFHMTPELRVGLLNHPSWNGPKAGLEGFDKVLAADGHPVTYQEDVDAAVRRVPVGTPIAYEIVHQGTRRLVTVRTQILTATDFARVYLLNLVVALLYLIIGAVAFSLRPREPAARSLMVGSAVAALALLMTVNSARWSLVLNGADFAIGPALIYFAVSFPRPLLRLQGRMWPVGLLFVLPVLVGLGVVPYYPPLFGALTVCGLLVAAGRMIGAWRSNPGGQARHQVQVVLLGFLAALLPYLVTYSVPLALEIPYSGTLARLSLLFTILIPLSITYAIVRHRLFDIEVVVKKTVVYAVVIASMSAIYFLIVALVRSGIELATGAANHPVGNFLATAVVALLFGVVHDRARSLADRLFYRSPYDFQRVVTSFGEQAREILEPGQLLLAFCDHVDGALQPTYLAVLTRLEATGEFVLAGARGLPEASSLVLPADHPEVRRLLGAGGTTCQDEVVVGYLRQALSLPLFVNRDLLGLVLVGPRKADLPYRPPDRLLLISLAQQLAVWLRNAQHIDQHARRAADLEELLRLYESANAQAMSDPLTGLYNRRAFRDLLGRSLAETRRYQRPLSLIILDIDHFKQFNDRFGHGVGDEVIVSVATAFRQCVRTSDYVARWGGEEFLVALPETDLPGSWIVAERIRREVPGRVIEGPQGESVPPVTVSLGVACFRPDDTIEKAIARADAALYVAKKKGRNQIQSLDRESRAAKTTFL